MMVRRDVWNSAGGFDAKNLPVSFNDVDFCLRLAEMGLRNVYTPYSRLIHLESFSRERVLCQDEVRYMKGRWASWIERDPFYNPNLSRVEPNFSIAPC